MKSVIVQSSFDRSTHYTHPGMLQLLIFFNTFSAFTVYTIQCTIMCFEVEISSTAISSQFVPKGNWMIFISTRQEVERYIQKHTALMVAICPVLSIEA